jgi:hypothetical protein
MMEVYVPMKHGFTTKHGAIYHKARHLQLGGVSADKTRHIIF